jgi:hypothetical protein
MKKMSNNLCSIKIQNLSSEKNSVKRIKIQDTNGENIFKRHI